MSELMHLNHAVGQNTYHLIWKPKWAKYVLNGGVEKCCLAALRRVSKKYGMKLIELEVMPDHVHCFVELKPSMSVSKALQLLKGYSAKKIFEHFPELRLQFRTGHFWSPGKFFRSVGSVTSETIQKYIAESNRGWKHQKTLARYPAL